MMASVIVINFNGRPYLESCLRSLDQQSYAQEQFEVILVDNKSSDHSVEWAQANFPRLKIVRSSKNLGYAGGANLGAKHAQGELLAFLNNDVCVDQKWLSNVVAAEENETRNAIVGSKILLAERPSVLNHAGGLISYLGAGFDIGLGMPDRTPSHIFPTGYVSGAALMIPQKLFHELRGFDEKHFLYCEDVDICWRAWLQGYRVVLQPAASLWHSFQSTKSRSGYWIRYFHWHKNALTNVFKNFGLQALFFSLMLHAVLQSARVLSAIRWSSPRRVIVLFRVNAWVLRNLKPIMARRAIVQSSRRIGDQELVRKGIFLTLRNMVTLGRPMFLLPET